MNRVARCPGLGKLRMRSALVSVGLAVLLVVVVSPNGSATVEPRTTQPEVWETIKVTLQNRSLSLSKRRVERGTFVSFVVVNSGRIQRSFAIGGRQERFIDPGATLRFELFFDLRGEFPYQSTSPRQGALVLRGSFQVY